MDSLLKRAQELWAEYLFKAVTPLHALTWQTGSLLLIILLSAMLIAYWITTATWLFSKPALKGVKVKSGPHTYKDHLRVSTATYMRFHGRDPQIGIGSDVVKRDVARDASRYYVVTVVESGRRSPILVREMHLQFASRRYAVAEGAVQFDSEALNEIRLGNTSQDDDEGGSDVAGTYDVYIRRVRWYDVRHWLTHPNREIRIVLWVTIITTVLPFFFDALFGRR